MSSSEEKHTAPPRPTVSELLPDGGLIELVYQPEKRQTHLAVFQRDTVSLEETVSLNAGERLVPISAHNNLIKHRALLLPEKPEAFGSVSNLITDIQNYLHRYVDLSDAFKQIASHYILLTWVYDVFNELPYLRLRGDYGSGKTRALLIIGSLCYRAFFASGASTVSPIFHTLDAFRGTLVFDEADFRFSNEKAELVKIFNNGNVRGFPVLRTAMTPKREFNPQAFAVFGPKIVAMRQSFQDQALESRFITEEMGQRTLRGDIPINLPASHEDEARLIRNKLLMYRFMHRHRIGINDALIDPLLSPRLNQILLPLLSVIEDDDTRRCVRRAAETLEREIRAERSATAEAKLVEVLAKLLESPARPTVPVSEITASFVKRFGSDFERPVTNRYIGHLLRTRLRLSTHKSHGVYVVPASEKAKLEVLCARYGVSQASEDMA